MISVFKVAPEEWLLSEPENLSFRLFFEDLLDIYKQKTLFIEKVSLASMKYIVNYNEKEEIFAIQSDEKKFILSKEDIKTMFFTLKNRGKLCHEDIAHELYQYRDEIFDFFTKLGYVLKNEDKIILNYTKKADISESEVLDEL